VRHRQGGQTDKHDPKSTAPPSSSCTWPAPTSAASASPVEPFFSDNGSCYRHHRFKHLLRSLGLGQRFTRIYRPQTNGKAERFIQTMLREWAYARTYQTSDERTAQLEPWLHDYNFHRPHASLNHNTPASRAGLNRNNLLSLHSFFASSGYVCS